MILFFDTETSGLFLQREHYAYPNQPWVCQLGLILADREQIYSEMCFLIEAGSRVIDLEAQKVHGISVDLANLVGLKEATAAGIFLFMLSRATKLVGHNIDFDISLMQSLLYRQGHQLGCSKLEQIPRFCTMKNSVGFCKILQEKYPGRFKWPRLEELYEILFHRELKRVHNALIDAKAARECYYALQDLA